MHTSIGQITKYCTIAPLVLMGGTDINPKLYGQIPLPQVDEPDFDRDDKELKQIEFAIKHKMPIIGICRGAQLLCVAAGGTLFQHSVGHNTSHEVIVRGIVSDQPIKIKDVAADHHQIMRCEETVHKIYGFANKETKVWHEDGTIESITIVPEIVFFPKINALAIQPHPEWMNKVHPFNIYLTAIIKTLFGDKNV